jgi:hypothetical protein
LPAASGSDAAVIPTIIMLLAALVIAPIMVTSGNHVGPIVCFVAVTSSSLATIVVVILSAP